MKKRAAKEKSNTGKKSVLDFFAMNFFSKNFAEKKHTEGKFIINLSKYIV